MTASLSPPFSFVILFTSVISFPLCFLTSAMRVYKVPEEEQKEVLAFIGSLDIRAIATKVMHKLFSMLEMTFDFKLSKDSETEKII